MIKEEEYLKAKNTIKLYEAQLLEEANKDIDRGLGFCTRKGCIKYAVTDYNGHGCFVCKDCDDILNREFEDEYK